jgi:hypothetical protein
MKSFAAALLAFGFALLVCAADPQTNAVLKSHLPVISLSTTQAIVSDRKVPCTVAVRSPNGGTNVSRGVVRIHGATSQAYPKKSYGFTLDKPAAIAGLSEREHYVLNAAFVDRSLMRHKLSYDLFRAMSWPGAPRYASGSRFVELELNGQYNGAYLLLERVDRALLQLTPFNSNAPSHACIYKVEDHTGHFAQPGHPGYEQRFPDPQVKEYWKPLDELAEFASKSSDADFLDAQKGIASRLDLDSAIDFQLLVLLTSNMDGIDKNFIIARDVAKPNAPAPRFFFVPWDYDATFGRNWESSRVGTNEWQTSFIFERLHKSADYRKKFAARWKELRAKQFSIAAIHKMIDDNSRALGDAAERNQTRWHMKDFSDRITYQQDCAEMKAWVASRVAWLDAEIARRAQ